MTESAYSLGKAMHALKEWEGVEPRRRYFQISTRQGRYYITLQSRRKPGRVFCSQGEELKDAVSRAIERYEA